MVENNIYEELLFPNYLPNMEELTLWKNKWWSTPYDIRKKSNDLSIEKYGFDNVYRYKMAEKEIYNKYNKIPVEDVDDVIVSSPISEYAADIAHIFDNWEYKLSRILQVESDGLVIMILKDIPTYDGYDIQALDRLEGKYRLYQTLNPSKRSIANNTAFDIFGIDNDNLYVILKNKCLSDKPIETPNDRLMKDMSSSITTESTFTNMINKYFQYIDESYDKELYESVVRTNINDSMRYCDEYLPYFRPEEMVDMGVFGENNYYSNTPDNTMINETSTREWFNSYYLLSGNRNPESFIVWENKIRELYSDYNNILESGNVQAILNRKQSILELGWNPEIPYSRDIASRSRYRRDNNILEYVDLSKYYNAYSDEEISIKESVEDDSIRKDLVPIYIILLGMNKSMISKTIKWWTKSEWSHAAISLYSDLNNVYSYSIQPREDGNKEGGFNKENIHKWLEIDPNCTLAVHALFIKKSQFLAIRDKINWYVKNINKTKYSLRYIARLVLGLREIPGEQLNLICSQFVMILLKSLGVKELSDKISKIVVPEDISHLEDSRLYKLYHGRADGYNRNKILRMCRDIVKKIDIRIYKESIHQTIKNVMTNVSSTILDLKYAIYNEYTTSSIYAKNLLSKALLEINPLSIQSINERVVDVDSNDDRIIIRTVDDVNTEFFKCHRNLKSYEKSGNYQGMKDELCKLKYLDNYAVKKMKNKYSKHYKEYADAHARITNDFNKYLKIVTDKEPDFNFSEYYRKSEWYDGEKSISKKLIADILRIIAIILGKSQFK